MAVAERVCVGDTDVLRDGETDGTVAVADSVGVRDGDRVSVTLGDGDRVSSTLGDGEADIVAVSEGDADAKGVADSDGVSDHGSHVSKF